MRSVCDSHQAAAVTYKAYQLTAYSRLGTLGRLWGLGTRDLGLKARKIRILLMSFGALELGSLSFVTITLTLTYLASSTRASLFRLQSDCADLSPIYTHSNLLHLRVTVWCGLIGPSQRSDYRALAPALADNINYNRKFRALCQWQSG